jgi:hypothetical protein
MKSATTSAPDLHLGTMILFLKKRSNQLMTQQRPHCEKISACLPRHPAVAYLRVVANQGGCLATMAQADDQRLVTPTTLSFSNISPLR